MMKTLAFTRKSLMNAMSATSRTQHSVLNGSNVVTKQELDLEVNRIVWLDMEMTGLNVEKDTIMEIASIVTDSNLNVLAEGPDLIIHHDQKALENMDEWCTKQHGKSGLTEGCLNSKITLQEAEAIVYDFVTRNVTEKNSPLAGNSVYMDRLFLQKYMPRIHNFLHYRIIDVSTIKELCRRWNPEVYKTIPKKEFKHRALDDIRESIGELKFYRDNFFNASQKF